VKKKHEILINADSDNMKRQYAITSANK